MPFFLKNQQQISHQHPLPVDVTDEASRVTDISAEAIAFVVASTNVADVGSAAGVVVYSPLSNTTLLLYFQTPNSPTLPREVVVNS